MINIEKFRNWCKKFVISIKDFFYKLNAKLGIVKHTDYSDVVTTEVPVKAFPLMNREFETSRFFGRFQFRVISYKYINENFYTKKGKKVYDYNETHKIERWRESLVLQVFPTQVYIKFEDRRIRIDDKPIIFRVYRENRETGFDDEIIEAKKIEIDVGKIRTVTCKYVLLNRSEFNDVSFNLPIRIKMVREDLAKELEEFIEAHTEEWIKVMEI